MKPPIYGNLLTISKTIKIRRTRHAGHCWNSKGDLIKKCPSVDTDEQVLDIWPEPIYNSFLQTQDEV